MAYTPDAPAGPLSDSADADEPDPSGGQSRGGLFSRLREVFAPPEPATPVAAPALHATLPMPGILNLRKLRVDDVAVPKTEIVAVPVTIAFDDLVTTFRDTGLTRIPVYDGELDHAIGLVNLKDFALRHGFRAEATEFDLRALLRPLLFVPPSMQASVLLQKMQAERTHMALVIDEYGGTDGLVTIEDLVETVVGAIDDEHDDETDAAFHEERPGIWLAQATTEVEEFERAIGHALTAHARIDAEDIDTLGGLVFMLAGHVPGKGEVIVHPDGPEFEVIDADPRRILRLRVRLPQDWILPEDDG